MLTVLLIGSSCKKVYNYPEKQQSNVGKPQDVAPSTGEISVSTQAEITSRTWIATKHYGYTDDQKNDVRQIKFVSGQYTVTVKRMPATLFWSPDFKEGTTVSGSTVWDLYQL